MSPGRTAFVYEDRAVTYAEFHERVMRLASRLRAAGVAPGDRVAYLGKNHVAFAESMFATHALGAIFVPLNFRLAAPEIDYMLENSGAVLLIYAPECAQTVRALTGRHALRERVALGEPGPGEAQYEAWLSEGVPEPIDVPVALDDTALILYTSGTTGRPKGAMLSHANLVWNCFNLLANVDVASDEVTLISAPLFHVAALNQTLLPTFLKGGCSVIMPSWDVDRCYDLIEKYRVTWMFGVTTMFAALASSPRWAQADLSSVRTLMSGGAPIPVSLIRTYQERGLVFCQGYGLTETSPGATFLEAGESVRKAGSAGVPVFFTNVRVVRPDLTDVEPGEPCWWPASPRSSRCRRRSARSSSASPSRVRSPRRRRRCWPRCGTCSRRCSSCSSACRPTRRRSRRWPGSPWPRARTPTSARSPRPTC